MYQPYISQLNSYYAASALIETFQNGIGCKCSLRFTLNWVRLKKVEGNAFEGNKPRISYVGSCVGIERNQLS